MSEVKQLNLNQIAIDAGTQVRAQVSPDVVADYAEAMEAGATFPPVVVFADGKHNFLADGFHRLLAAYKNDYLEITAEVHPGTREDALWFALGANKANGQRLTRGDIRAAVEMALQAWPQKSQTEIATQVGCSQQYVGKVKEDITTSCNVSIPEKRKDSLGRMQPTQHKRKEGDVQQEEDANTEQQNEPETKDMEGWKLKKKYMRKTPTACGLFLARVAVLRLNEIPDDDTEMEDAKQLVKGWLNERNK